MAELEAELGQVESQLADPAVYGNDGGIEVAQLAQRQEKLAREKETLEAEWLSLLEASDA